MKDSVRWRLIAKFNPKEDTYLPGLYSEPPRSATESYPEVPPPDSPLSPRILAARWASHDLYGEDMPSIAADLLEAGYDTPTLRRLAGEMQVACSADVEDLVGRMFGELGVLYPLSERHAKLIVTRQIAREVIAGERNAWAAANHLEIAIWSWKSGTTDLEALFSINDEINWNSSHRRPVAVLNSALLETLARLAVLSDEQVFA
jgi:hypothetical protein